MAHGRSARHRAFHGRARASVHTTVRSHQGFARSWATCIRFDAKREERTCAAVFGCSRSHSKTRAWGEASMRSALAYDFHIVVVGGGMVGACTAALLAIDP